MLMKGARDGLQVGQMTLLQHSSLYESIASWLQSAQKKFLGKTVVGRELRALVRACRHMAMQIHTERTPSGRP
jgi:hypothetical protein